MTPGFPVDETDSTCLPTHQAFIKNLLDRYPAIKIIVVSFQYPAINNEYHWNGIQVICMNADQSKSFLKRCQKWLQIWRTLKKIHTKNKILGIFSFWATELAFVGKYFAVAKKITFRIWITGQDAKKGNKFIPLINPKPAELVAMSDFLTNEFYTNYHVKPGYVIPNGIDSSLFKNDTPEKAIDLLAVGSLIPLKQYQIFITVVAELKKNIPNLNCLICGDGPERTKLMNLTEEYNLTATISFAGEVPHSKALDMMQRSKILLHPSSYEGFSTVCLEALYAGAHVVSFIKPMDHDIMNWHIAKTTEEMTTISKELLTNPTTKFESIEVYKMSTIAKEVMQLFGF